MQIHPTLETELTAAAQTAVPGRAAELAIKRWGWDGRGGQTLASLGDKHQISRERVRQLCERVATALGGAAGADERATPVLDQALALGGDTVPTTAAALARRLADAHLAAAPFHPAGLLSAAAMLGRDAPFALAAIRDIDMALPAPPDPAQDPRELVAAVLDTAHALVRHGGAARSSEITGKVAAALGAFVEDAFVVAVLSAGDDFTWLDRRAGWFALPSLPRNAVAARVLKLLAVCGELPVAELHTGIRRDERMREFVLPEYVLAELCARLPGVALGADRAGAPVARLATPLEEGGLLEATEATMVAILRREGGDLERHEFERRCREAGVSAAAFAGRLSYSPLLAEHGAGRYGLRTAGTHTRLPSDRLHAGAAEEPTPRGPRDEPPPRAPRPRR